MLIDFSVENFRSFGAEQTLNLVASGKLQDHEDHCVPIGETGKSVLRAAVIYGANAAGKSNLVRAIDFARDLILGIGSTNSVASNAFRFSKTKKPLSFRFRFMVNGQIFAYGFSINKIGIVYEWLDATTEKGEEKPVFKRQEQEIMLGKLSAFGGKEKTSAQTLRLLKQLGTRPDQLLLSKIVELDESRRGDLLNPVAWWFHECLTVVQPDSRFGPLIQLLDEGADFRQFAGAFLRNAGTGIDELHVEQSEILADKLPRNIRDRLQSANDKDVSVTIGDLGVNLRLDPADPTKVTRRNLAALHHVQDADFSIPFQDESDGTQRCVNLLPALYHLTTSCKLFIIDEIDRSLHPLLSHAFLQFFVESCPGACQQMIVTTHETHLLDQELLRRDEIWFVEKDDKQQTQLYSLAEMKIRNDVRIEKGYLQGRFGGIPFIGDSKKLMDMLKCPNGGKPHAKKTPS